MFKILEDKKTNKFIAVDLETGAVYEETGGVGASILEEIKMENMEADAPVKRHYKKARKVKAAKKVEASGNVCRECGKEPISGRCLSAGLCPNCYQRGLYWKKKKEKNGGAKNYECIDCGATITSELNVDEVVCPKNEMHKLVQK